MNFEQLTFRTQEAFKKAQEIADKHHQRIGPEHLLLSFLQQPQGILSQIFARQKFSQGHLERKLKGELYLLPRFYAQERKPEGLNITPNLSLLLTKAEKEASRLEDLYISEEHIARAMILDEEGKIYRIFKELGLSSPLLIKELEEVRGGERITLQNPEGISENLKQYGKNLTEMALEGKLDPVIARDKEIRQVILILSRRTKNNPVLIGDPGVGKTALVHGLAQKIVSQQVPKALLNKQIFALDLSSLLAGARYRGEFEERFKNLLKEIISTRGEVIVFLDELHTVLGAGSAEGSMDASSLLKPLLSSPDLRCIGATTLKEYRKYVEKDPAFERRFQPVLLEEPDVRTTTTILRGLKKSYEDFHGVKIKDEALSAAAALSHRYVTDRFLPDKAIDLMDEAAALLCNELESRPETLEDLYNHLSLIEMDIKSLYLEDSPEARASLEELEKELTFLKKEIRKSEEIWIKEKMAMDKIFSLRDEIDEIRREIEDAEDNPQNQNSKFGSPRRLEEKLLKDLEEKLRQQEKVMDKSPEFAREYVGAEDIARVTSRWTGIPLNKVLEGERAKLLNLEERLHERLIGQDEAVKAVSDAVLRARSGVKDPQRPVGSFIFSGPTGVGKTELARSLAITLFDKENALIRLDMSEYMEKHSVARLTGAPPGYVGFEEGGQLTNAVRKQPFAVVLLDEIEKAHPDVFNILLQILDEGRLTDSQGRLVDFKNTVIIMTSNLGGELIQREKNNNYPQIKEKLLNKIQQFFRPEFINRIDEVVVFHPLSQENLKEIVKIQISYVADRLKEKKVYLNLTSRGEKYLTEKGFDPAYGARPLKRVILKEIETPLARELIEGSLVEGQKVLIDADEKGIYFTPDKSLKEVAKGE